MTTYNINEELNGIEIIFDERPNAGTLETLKSAGFRWHKVKKLWYAKQTPERVELAKMIADGKTETPTTSKPADKINLDGIEAKKTLYGAELTKAIREELKRRGVTGATVKKSGHQSVCVTLKATPADIVSIEEAKERYNFSAFSANIDYHGIYNGEKWIYYNDFVNMTDEEKNEVYKKFLLYNMRKNEQIHRTPEERERNKYYFYYTTEFFNKIRAAFIISNQWNYDNSDIMTDYFDYGYYLQIDIIKPENIETRETMAEAEKTALDAERQEERRKAEEADRKYEEERKAREEAYKRAEEAAKKRDNAILNGYKLEELEKPLYFKNLVGGIGKEATAAELEEAIAEHTRKYDCIVNYKLTLTPEALEAYKESFLHDFEFLAGKGGSDTSDIRIKDYKYYTQLNADQRETVKFYNVNCVGVYDENNKLQFVVDPQGYSYSRYVYKPTEETTETDAETETAKQEEESKAKPAFYIPAPVAEQVENLKVGDPVTVYQCDGWMLNSIEAGHGIIESVNAGNYAQYSGYYLTLKDGKKEKKIFLRDNKETLIYNGIFEKLPAEVTQKKITETTAFLLNYNELFPATLKYYAEQGKTPIFDTFQR